jgi:nitrogen regulatory protein PII
MKKAEIVIENLEVREVIKILDTLKVSGYTIVNDVYGRSDRGNFYNDLERELSNSYVMTTCNSDRQVNEVATKILPIIKKHGGMFLLNKIDRTINLEESFSDMTLVPESMETVKKVEIVINSLHTESALKILDSLKVSGYTVIEDTSGKGDRGVSCSDLDCVFSSRYILTVCTNEQQLEMLLEKLTPLLKKVGGICLVSEAHWISH